MNDPEKQPADGNPMFRRTVSGPARHQHHHSTLKPEFSDLNVNYSQFAGRLGGNQLFTLDTEDPEYDVTKARIPDAVVASTWREILDLRAFKERRLWEMAFIEGIGVAMQVWASGIIGQALIPYAAVLETGPLVPVSLACVFQFIMISIFTFSLGPVTGAHLNPLITIGTFVVKLSSLPRTVLYVVFQCIGGIIGAFILRGCLGMPKERLEMMTGCYVDPSLVTPGEAFAFETMSSLFLLFLAFGLGLDPRNSTSFGPSLGPFLIGLASTLTVFTGAIARPGYLGTSNNPARCLGLNAASGRFTYHYIFWVGDIAAATINGIAYNVVPPFDKKKYQ